MGTISYHTSLSYPEAVTSDIESGGSHKVVKRSGRYYAVEEVKTGDVFAVVALGRKTRGEVSIKLVDEGMGPFHWDCPASILNLLSPTTSEYALKWRDECRTQIELKKAQPKLQEGAVVVLATPVRFTDGVETDRFVFQKNSRFIRSTDGEIVSLGQSWKTRLNWSVV